MLVKQKIKRLVLGLVLLGSVITGSILPAAVSFADEKCAGVTTAIIKCDESGGSTGSLQNSGIWGLLILAIQILTAGVGVAALAGIVYGVILYTTSRGDPAGIKKAIEVIRNVVIGIVAYALMWSALNWLIPGGVFN
jgi:hypothetical protein